MRDSKRSIPGLLLIFLIVIGYAWFIEYIIFPDVSLTNERPEFWSFDCAAIEAKYFWRFLIYSLTLFLSVGVLLRFLFLKRPIGKSSSEDIASTGAAFILFFAVEMKSWGLALFTIAVAVIVYKLLTFEKGAGVK